MHRESYFRDNVSTFLLLWLGRYPSWWTISSWWYHPPSDLSISSWWYHPPSDLWFSTNMVYYTVKPLLRGHFWEKKKGLIRQVTS